LALCTEGVIDRQHLPPTVGSTQQPAPLPPSGEALEVQLQGLLRTHQGNVAAVARAMGKAPIQIHRWVKKLELDLSAYRPPNKRNDH
jgi:transposase-like protein